MRSRRGFTLVEVLVAIGLLVMLTSLALPVALTNTTSARATTAERLLKLAPNTARSEAQRLGQPVAIVLLPSEDGTTLRLSIVRQPDPQSQSARDRGADPDDVSTWPAVDEARLMPTGTRLWAGDLDELDESADSDGFTSGGGSMLERAFSGGEPVVLAAAGDGASEAVVLAWFLSDGSALAGRATAVRLADGRVVRVRVEALTGRLEFGAAPEPAAELAGGASPELESEAADARGDAFPSLGGSDLTVEPAEGRTFADLEFDELEFEDLSGGFDREWPEGTAGRAREGEPTEGREPDSPVRTNPQPPQPR